MKMKNIDERPDSEQLERELKRELDRGQNRVVLKKLLFAVMIVTSVSILLETLCFSFMKINGNSMSPTMKDGDIVVCLSTTKVKEGDVVAFYMDHKLLIKRIICGPGDTIDIDQNGAVSVNHKKVEEPVWIEQALGECDITFPYLVPEREWFVMGDHRSTSLDSRSQAIGCVDQEQIAGKILFRIWPLKHFGSIK